MKHFIHRIFSIFTISIFVFSFTVNAQNNDPNNGQTINTVTTAVPFLRIIPDARAGAMGDAGIAISPDANSIFHNPSKIAFEDMSLGIALNYSPWLRSLVKDVYLAQLSGYKKINDNQGLGLSVRYFSLGNIQFTDYNGNNTGEFKPNEFAIDGSYARKLSENFSAGLTLRFIYSNLATGQSVNGIEIKPGTAVASDMSFYYHKKLKLGDGDGSNFALGMNISNVGSKITYTESAEKDFLPMNLGIGSALGIALDKYNTINIAADVNKLLVPTPNPDNPQDRYNKSVIGGAIGSFSDAPGGFKEEMQELTYSVGIEYWYDKLFAVRTGYFNENKFKGNRKFFTAGIGLKYSVFGIDFSYLIPTTSQRDPLDRTLRFSLKFDFASFKYQTETVPDTPETF